MKTLAGLLFVLCMCFPRTVYAQVTTPNNMYVIPNRVQNAADHSGSITQGGSWQLLAASNSIRYAMMIENYCSATTQGLGTAESVFLSVATNMPTNLSGAIEISTCGSYRSDNSIVSTNNVWIYANTTGHLYVAKEW